MPTLVTLPLEDTWTKIADAGVEFAASTRTPAGLWSIAFVATEVVPGAGVAGHLVAGISSIATRQAFADATGFVYAKAENAPLVELVVTS